MNTGILKAKGKGHAGGRDTESTVGKQGICGSRAAWSPGPKEWPYGAGTAPPSGMGHSTLSHPCSKARAWALTWSSSSGEPK